MSKAIIPKAAALSTYDKEAMVTLSRNGTIILHLLPPCRNIRRFTIRPDQVKSAKKDNPTLPKF
jgi:hypothetical protein